MADYDVVVIGGGPGGYVCAIRAAQNGLNVACVEGRGALGGTCLNVGCIPSKALLHASELVHEAGGNFAKMGIDVGTPKVDVPKMRDYKDGVIKSNTKGIEFLFKKNKVDYVQGWGQIVSATEVKYRTFAAVEPPHRPGAARLANRTSYQRATSCAAVGRWDGRFAR